MDYENDAQNNPRNLRVAAKKKAVTTARKKPAPGVSEEEDLDDSVGLGKVVVRNEFYRDGYRLALRVAMIQSFAIILLIFAMYYIINVHQPEDKYFATTLDGRVIPMVPLDRPNLSTPALVSWVAQAATETMTFGFADYQRRLQESSRHFTKAGWAAFAKELDNTQIIENVKANYQLVTATPLAAPQIQDERVINERYQWKVKMPLLLTYESKNSTRNDRWDVTLIIVRVPRLESPNGVGIAQWLAAPSGGN